MRYLDDVQTKRTVAHDKASRDEVVSLLQQIIEQLEKPKLSSFKAHDQDNRDDLQYVGFANPDGNWYITQDKTSNNQTRYAYGHEDYSKGWEDREDHTYKTLGEAFDAPKT